MPPLLHRAAIMRMFFFFDYNVSITKEYIIITFPNYKYRVFQKNFTKFKL